MGKNRGGCRNASGAAQGPQDSVAGGEVEALGNSCKQASMAGSALRGGCSSQHHDAVVALGDLWDRCSKLGSSEQDHFVFPACENGHIDPTRPMKGWRSAWRSLTKAAGLKGLRFHDLRHQAITELGESGQTIMSIAGHVSRRMLDLYSHIRLQAKRKALDGLETPADKPSTAPQDTTVENTPE